MGLVAFGKGTRAPMSLGIFGGYPGCNVGYDLPRRQCGRAAGPPRGAARRRAGEPVLGAARGSPTATSSRSASWAAAATATPSTAIGLVLRDVLAGLVTEEPARDVYGVVVDGDDVDAEATRARRRELREARLGRPFDGPDERADVPRTGRRLSEYLQRTEAGIDAVHMV